jgi:hypothetical protein
MATECEIIRQIGYGVDGVEIKRKRNNRSWDTQKIEIRKNKYCDVKCDYIVNDIIIYDEKELKEIVKEMNAVEENEVEENEVEENEEDAHHGVKEQSSAVEENEEDVVESDEEEKERVDYEISVLERTPKEIRELVKMVKQTMIE